MTQIQGMTRILFVDDKSFRVVNILQKQGWRHVDKVNDVDNLSDDLVVNAHILFVDIMGVGKSLMFRDEGLGLIRALKEKYPEKRVIIYSANPNNNIFNGAIDLADARLDKNAEPIEFINRVEQFAQEAFSFKEFLVRIKRIMSEYGIDKEMSEMEKEIARICADGKVNDSLIRKYLKPSSEVVFLLLKASLVVFNEGG